jgi:hypothetical protein
MMNPSLIAPCGMNCNICLGHLRENNRCPGCNIKDDNKPKTRTNCYIKNCKVLKHNDWKYCSKKCESYPCQKLTNLDKRYRIKYSMSMIDNLEFIDKNGIRKFIKNEDKKWIKGNKIFCVHNKKYFGL